MIENCDWIYPKQLGQKLSGGSEGKGQITISDPWAKILTIDHKS
jgi:hypothetical protein